MARVPRPEAAVDRPYVRSATADVDPRLVLRGAAVVVLVVMLAVVAVTSVGAARQVSQQDALAHPVGVQVRITSCAGVSSGIGQAVQYYDCHGSYDVGGRTYTEELRGNRAAHPLGSVVAAVVAAGRPTLLAVPSSARGSASWTPFATPLSLLAVTVAGVVAALLVSRRRRRGATGPAPTAAVTGGVPPVGSGGNGYDATVGG
jgi:hypothetical protein